MDHSKQYDGKLAAIYAQEASSRAQDDLGRAFLKNQLTHRNRADVLVDAGCGSGIDLLSYNQMGFSNLFGFDPALSVVEMAKRALHNKARVICGELEHLPFADQSIDIMSSRFSLMYCNDIGGIFAEAARVLKPGGLFAAVVSHPVRDARLPVATNGTVSVTFFDGAMTATYPRHTEDDYLGPAFTKDFEHITREEFSDRASAGYVNAEILSAPECEPTVLCFSGIRKVLPQNRHKGHCPQKS